jgi:hypothetical protein
MAIKHLILAVLGALVVAFVLLVVSMLPVQHTSGSGEGNILTTQTP